MLRKAIYIPKGIDFLKYASNRIKNHIKIKRYDPIVSHPTSLMIELTNHCQLKCTICPREYYWGNQMDVGHMDFEQFKKIIDDNHVYLDRVGLTGLGETLLYPRIVDAVNYIGSKNKGIMIYISTNACQVNSPSIVEELARKIDTLQISIDGIGSTFEKIRKKAKYDQWYANLEQITRFSHKTRMHIKFSMVVFKYNFKEMVNVIDLANELSVREVYFNIFNLVANKLRLSEYSLYQTSEFRDELNKALVKAKRYGIFATHHHSNDRQKGFRFCAYPWDNFYITWDGFVVPCCAKPFPKVLNFGNVFSDSLISILNNTEYQKFRKMSKKNQTPDFCRRCYIVF